jgi:hypothetical protein
MHGLRGAADLRRDRLRLDFALFISLHVAVRLAEAANSRSQWAASGSAVMELVCFDEPRHPDVDAALPSDTRFKTAGEEHRRRSHPPRCQEFLTAFVVMPDLRALSQASGTKRRRVGGHIGPAAARLALDVPSVGVGLADRLVDPGIVRVECTEFVRLSKRPSHIAKSFQFPVMPASPGSSGSPKVCRMIARSSALITGFCRYTWAPAAMTRS